MSAAGLKKKLLLATGTVAFTILVAEVVVRIAMPVPGFKPFPAYQEKGQVIPHATRGFTLKPGFRGEVVRAGKKVEIRINAQGFVGPEAATDGSETLILAVGDSMTEGWGLDPSDAWPAQLEQRLHARGASDRIGVINAGVVSYGIREIRVTAEELLEEYRPRMLIVGLYVLGYDRVTNPYRLHGGYVVRGDQVAYLLVEDDGFFLSVFRRPWLQRLDRFCARYLRVGSLALRATPDASRQRVDLAPRAGNRELLRPFLDELGRIKAATDRAGIPCIALLISIQDSSGKFDAGPDEHSMLRGQPELIRAVADYCSENGIIPVDMLPVLQSRADGRPIFALGDDFHWSAAANALAADELARLVVQPALGALGPDGQARR